MRYAFNLRCIFGTHTFDANHMVKKVKQTNCMNDMECLGFLCAGMVKRGRIHAGSSVLLSPVAANGGTRV